MWQRDRGLEGPERATARDVEALNRVFSSAFTERYRKDGLSGVRVPFLNPLVWQFAIADAGEGAMVWRDARGDLLAFNMVHHSGSEGWMGPLAVRTDRQGTGVGRRIVSHGISWLEAKGVKTIGLETMPRTIDNIGFYSKLGFVPGPLTITLQHDGPRGSGPLAERFGSLNESGRADAFAECTLLVNAVARGVDFTREIELTLEHGLGDATLLRDGEGTMRGFAVWHTAPLAMGRPKDELRILKFAARDTAAALELIAAVECEANLQGLARVSLRCQMSHPELYSELVLIGYRVHWTDLRMTLAGKGEAVRSGILLSNWEI